MQSPQMFAKLPTCARDYQLVLVEAHVTHTRVLLLKMSFH